MHRRTQQAHYLLGVMLVAALLLAGCGRPYTRDEFVGAWVAEDGGVIVIERDTFRATGIKRDAVAADFHGPLAETCFFAGKWHIERGMVALNNGPIIREKDGRVLEAVGGFNYMEIAGRGDRMRIYFVIGDPDNVDYYEFTRQAAK